MSLDPATVRRIARLARIHVDAAQVAQLQGELNGILGWIEMLNEVNVDGVPVRIVFDKYPDVPLEPGLSTSVTVDTTHTRHMFGQGSDK